MWNLLLIGWITVASSVSGADVMVDEQDGIRMQGNQLRLQVETGQHVIMVDKEGYLPYITVMNIHQGENPDLTVRLEPANKKKNWSIRWVGVGGSIGSGLNIRLSIANMQFKWFTLDPCIWGINLPFFSNVSHVKQKWQVHPRDRRSDIFTYEMAIPSPDVQFYYTPMIGAQIPLGDRETSLAINAGPQISWTHTYWEQLQRDLPLSYSYEFTKEPFPQSGFHFDPIWFSAQVGVVFKGVRSDLLAYFQYQDGYFVGIELRF